MPSIFANKDELIKKYKELFHENLKDFGNLLNCVETRYNSKPYPQILLNGSKDPECTAIKTFVKPANSNRANHFFGFFNKPDSRDAQLAYFDRFILDSVHHHVMHLLQQQLLKDYADNEESISQTWKTELEANELIMDPNILINYLGNTNKAFFLQDLKFPEQEQVKLFAVDYSEKSEQYTLLVHQQFFSDWLEPYDYFEDSNENKFTSDLLMNMIFCALLSTPCGLAFGPMGAAIAAFVGLVIGALAVIDDQRTNGKTGLRLFNFVKETENNGFDEMDEVEESSYYFSSRMM